MTKAAEYLDRVISEEKHDLISLQTAKDKSMFGPVWHGTNPDRRAKISQEGFKVEVGDARTGDIKHGYSGETAYYSGIPAPVHHLGYGVYFTTSKAIAKSFNGGTEKGLTEFYINIKPDRLATINFGAPRTMMNWWIENGYDPELAKINRVEATKKLTDGLKSKYDAVWFKGKGMRRLLDGDQIVVFDTSLINEIDKKLTQSGDIGSKVVAKEDIVQYKGREDSPVVPKGTKGILLGRRPIEEKFRQYNDGATEFLEIKWSKGGRWLNVYPSQVEFGDLQDEE